MLTLALTLACNDGGGLGAEEGFGPRPPIPDSPHAGCTPGTELASIEALKSS